MPVGPYHGALEGSCLLLIVTAFILQETQGSESVQGLPMVTVSQWPHRARTGLWAVVDTWERDSPPAHRDKPNSWWSTGHAHQH